MEQATADLLALALIGLGLWAAMGWALWRSVGKYIT